MLPSQRVPFIPNGLDRLSTGPNFTIQNPRSQLRLFFLRRPHPVFWLSYPKRQKIAFPATIPGGESKVFSLAWRSGCCTPEASVGIRRNAEKTPIFRNLRREALAPHPLRRDPCLTIPSAAPGPTSRGTSGSSPRTQIRRRGHP